MKPLQITEAISCNDSVLVLEPFEILETQYSEEAYKEHNRNDGFRCYLVTDADGVEILRAKFRWTNNPSGSVCHCLVWIREIGFAKGKARGYGYCKESASLSDALETVGVRIRNLSGSGQTREALNLFVRALGVESAKIYSFSF